jgi:hypothetical protein
MGLLYGRAGRLAAENGGFRPGQNGTFVNGKRVPKNVERVLRGADCVCLAGPDSRRQWQALARPDAGAFAFVYELASAGAPAPAPRLLIDDPKRQVSKRHETFSTAIQPPYSSTKGWIV